MELLSTLNQYHAAQQYMGLLESYISKMSSATIKTTIILGLNCMGQKSNPTLSLHCSVSSLHLSNKNYILTELKAQINYNRPVRVDERVKKVVGTM